jgi:hypothetical protein
MFVPTWYDPPSGWKYGFPKAWPKDLERTRENIAAQLIEDGYPKSEIPLALDHTRFGGIFQ